MPGQGADGWDETRNSIDMAPISLTYRVKLNTLVRKYKIRKQIDMKLHVGQLAPDFTLPSHLDKDVTLNHLRGCNVVLAFFPQAWTPI